MTQEIVNAPESAQNQPSEAAPEPKSANPIAPPPVSPGFFKCPKCGTSFKPVTLTIARPGPAKPPVTPSLHSVAQISQTKPAPTAAPAAQLKQKQPVQIKRS